VDALVRWLRGSGSPEAALAYAADGRLRRLTDAGWVVDYADWRDVGGVELPGRIEARQGEARVRLVVDDWTKGTQ
jgi:outer membrane lipoprotein LolB